MQCRRQNRYPSTSPTRLYSIINYCIGKEIYNKTSGFLSLLPDAAPLHDSTVLKLGSATKLITSIALVQCVERGQIKGLDEPLTGILPELDGIQILKTVTESSDFIYEPTKTPITAFAEPYFRHGVQIHAPFTR